MFSRGSSQGSGSGKWWRHAGKLIACVGAVLVAAGLFVVSTLGSLVLWGRGLWGVWKWVCWRGAVEGKKVSGETERHRCPTAMPGQEHGDHWKHSWEMAKSRNYRISKELDCLHFNVAPLIKGTAGLGLEHLVMLVKKRSERSEREKDLKEVDREVAGGHLFPQRSRLLRRVPFVRSSSCR